MKKIISRIARQIFDSLPQAKSKQEHPDSYEGLQLKPIPVKK